MEIRADDRDWFTWRGIAKIRSACEKQAANEGLAGIELFLRSQDLFSKLLSERTNYRQRQQDRKQYVSDTKPVWLTSDEIEYLMERLEGVNDPTGQDIALKLFRQQEMRKA